MSRIFGHKGFWLGLFVVVGGLGALAWVQREPLLAWHWTNGLAEAPSEKCEWYVERLAGLDGDALPPLFRQLHTGDATAKQNCGWALAELVRRWGLDAPASAELAQCLQASYGELDAAGRREALTILQALLLASGENNTPNWLHETLSHVLPLACRNAHEETRPAVLALAAQFMHQVRPTRAEWMAGYANLIDAGLKDPRPECRMSAIRLAAAPGVNLLERVARFLVDQGDRRVEASAEVRVLALLALGSHEELLPTDDLLPYLHDADAEVRSVCEQALRSRGLLPAHVQLAKQMTDPQPGVRARVPALVHDFPDLDPQLWLEKLSRDHSPAVRAAVLRAAGDGKEWRLADRMREMAKADPSPTVRQIAAYYLQQQLRDE